MTPHSPGRIIASVITALIALCYAPSQEARAQDGPGRGVQTKAAPRRLHPRPKKEENDKARELAEEGLRRADRKDWAGAMTALDQALAVNPRYGDAYIAIGDTYMNMGKYEEGFKAYRQATSVEPSNPVAHYSLGAAYNDMAMYGDAFKHFVQAIRLDSNFAEAHYGIGYAYLGLENYKEALPYLRRAAQLQSDYWEAHLALGRTYLGMGDVKGAERELKILAGLDASAAGDLEKEMRSAPSAAKPSDRAERGGRSESAPPPREQAVTKNIAPEQKSTVQEQDAGRPARPAARNQSVAPARAPVTAPRPAVPSGDSGLVVELSFWESIKNSNNPEEFAAYLNKYPEGQFAELAKIRMRAAGKKGEAPGGNSESKPPTPAVVAAPDNQPKPVSQTPAYEGEAQQPKAQLSEEQTVNEKEQPKEESAAERPKSNEAGDAADAATVEATLDSLRRLLPSKFTYEVRAASDASAGGAVASGVNINYEPLKFESCTIEWRDQNDALRVSLPELDPEAVKVEPRSRPGTTFSIEVWNVSISAAGGKGAIDEAKGDGSGIVNHYNGLDLQYDNREKAERLARVLRQAIKLCAGKP